MARGNKGKDGFVPVPNVMIESEAWRQISGNAVKVYLIMCRVGYGSKLRFYTKYNDIEKTGIDRHAIKKIIAELVDCGFIEVITRGGHNGKTWNKNLYRFSDLWKSCTKTFRPGKMGTMADIMERARKDIYPVPKTALPLVPKTALPPSAENSTTPSAENSTRNILGNGK